MKKKSILYVSILGIAIVLFIVFKSPAGLFGKNEVAGPQKKSGFGGDRVINVKGFVANPVSFENKIYTTGSVFPNEMVEIRSEIAGRVTGIYFKEDSPVKKGQLLVKINDSDLKAQLTKLKVQVKLAEEDKERKSKLLGIKGISQEEYDRAETQLSALIADLELLKSQLDKTEIRAPFDGVVGLRYISEGGYISPNTLVANIQQLNPVKIEFTIPEKYAPKVTKGSKIAFTTAGQDKLYTGTVYAASTNIDAQTRTLTVRALAPNGDRALTPGAFVKVEFALETLKDAILVPSESVIPELGGQKVMLAKEGKVVTAKVETGIRTENEVQIIQGISPSDTIIVTGLMQIKDGAKVKVTEMVEKESLNLKTQTN